MAQPETDDELRRELRELRARVVELTHSAATAERDATRYRLLLEHLNVGVFVSTLDGRMLECNERTVQMSGESRESLLNKDLSTHYENPDDRARLVAELRGTGSVRNFETWTVHRDGTRVASSMNAVLAPIGPDGSSLILGMLEDITERKLAQERVGEGEERFRVIAEQSMLGLVILQDNAIRFANQAVSDINGYSIEEMSNWDTRDMAKAIHPDDLAFAMDQSRKKQVGGPGALAHYSYRIITKSGETRWVENYSRSIEYGGRPADFVTMIDVTARKQAELSLNQLSLSMERTAKLESLGVLAAGIAHDFNNLLGGLFGHLDLARARLDADSAARSHLDLAHEAFERAKGLTGQLLAFAKGGVPVRKVGSLAASVRQCAEFALSGSNVKVELDLEPELHNAEFDSNQLAQAFDNILINAKQAMPAGGTLRILGRNVVAQRGPAPELPPGPYVKLSFADQGSGISPAILERIFDPFFTTKEVGRGSGLGLSMVYGFAKQSRGHVKIYSEVGHGTTVKLFLPRSRDKSSPLATREPAASAPMGNRELLLVVEDDPALRALVVQLLHRLGYRTVAAGDAAGALRLLAAETGVALLLADMVLPGGKNGAELSREAQALKPGLPVLFMSGYTENAVIHNGRLDPGVRLLEKPFTTSKLAQAVRQALGER